MAGSPYVRQYLLPVLGLVLALEAYGATEKELMTQVM